MRRLIASPAPATPPALATPASGRGMRPAQGRDWPGCANESPCSAGHCPPAGHPTAGSWSPRCSRSARQHDNRPRPMTTGSDMADGVTTRCLIADDQAMVREGFAAVLAAQPGMLVVGQAADGAGAVSQTRRLDPDVV